MFKWLLRARKLFFIIAREEIIPDLSLRGTKHPQPVIARHEAISLFGLPAPAQPRSPYPEGTLRCARPPTVIASLRSNLAFLFVSPGQPRSPYPEGTLRCARLPTVIASLRSNLAFWFASPSTNEIAIPRGHIALRSPSYCHCEPAKQSRFSVCQPRTTEIATFLAMTKILPLRGTKQSLFSGSTKPEHPRSPYPEGTLRCARPPTVIASLRSNLAFWFASLEQTRSHYPEGTLRCARPPTVIASLRSNLAFLFVSPGQPRSPRCARDDRTKREPAKHSPSVISPFVLPALDNRDRHTQRAHCAPLAMTKILSLRGTKQSLFSGSTKPEHPRSPYPEGTLRYARDDKSAALATPIGCLDITQRCARDDIKARLPRYARNDRTKGSRRKKRSHLYAAMESGGREPAL